MLRLSGCHLLLVGAQAHDSETRRGRWAGSGQATRGQVKPWAGPLGQVKPCHPTPKDHGVRNSEPPSLQARDAKFIQRLVEPKVRKYPTRAANTSSY